MATKTHNSTGQWHTVRQRIVLLALLGLVCTAMYVFYGVSEAWEYILMRRATRVLAMGIAGASIAMSTVIFQTISNNRILTPSIMGLDSLYILLQTFFIFFFGSSHQLVQNSQLNFALTVGFMLLFSVLTYRVFFRKEQTNIYFMLLIGIVLGTLFQSASSMLQVLIDPNEYLLVQDRMFASVNNVKSNLLPIASIATVATTFVFLPLMRYLDVLALGKEHAMNLGIDYLRVVRRLLMIVFVFISIATALIGPITFLGLIVANIAYEFLPTYRRGLLILGATLIGMIAMIGGQFIIEKIFHFSTALSVIINLIGGLYFLRLILKERVT